MSTPPLSSRALNLEQHHQLTKELFRAARDGDSAALARLDAVRHDTAARGSSFRLADARLAIARESGFESWAKLVDEVQARDIAAFRDAVRRADVASVEGLLATAHVRRCINDPMFDFGQRALHVAAKNAPMLAVLLAAGADVDAKSQWENGPYTVLDGSDEHTARFLLARGATLTANVAARLGWFDELQAIVKNDPGSAHARGGDGQQPLHEAKSVAIADFLLDHGAGIDVRCIDHKSTPAQYALVDRPDVCRRLLARGATPDIFMAARLGDVPLATHLLDTDPASAAARVNAPGYRPVPLFSIYCWSLGFGVSPHGVASKFGHRDVHDLLVERSPARIRFMNALEAADAEAAHAVLGEDASLLTSLTPEDHGRLALAIFHEQFDSAALMLAVGLNPAAGGMDGGTALHAACWVGRVDLVERLIAHGGVGLDSRDPTHQSTPLGWAAFGSVHRRAPGANYPAVVDRLVAAGADITAVGNGAGRSLITMAHGNPSMQDALRRHGAH